jgi:TolA-binding protein
MDKNYFYLLMFIFLFIGLSINNYINRIDEPKKIWEQVKELRTQKNLQDAITNCKIIISKYPENELAATALFQIGDIYLNDVQDYDFAISYFNEVVEKFPKSKECEKASFMIGYIFANNLDSYSDAEEYYKKFMESFPESELIQSVQFELMTLEPLLETIDSLNAIVEKE